MLSRVASVVEGSVAEGLVVGILLSGVVVGLAVIISEPGGAVVVFVSVYVGIKRRIKNTPHSPTMNLTILRVLVEEGGGLITVIIEFISSAAFRR